MDPLYGEIFLRAAEASRAGARPHHPQREPRPVDPPVVHVPTRLDVLNGRGQGVQRHPGNVKYRTLVSLNKGLYAECPRSDKAKISRGIVAAVRELGGNFLELDEPSGTYRDIGDKKACEKTSQALREGLKMIRQKAYGEMTSGMVAPPLHCNRAGAAGAISSEAYFEYSVQLLESLHGSDGDAMRRQAFHRRQISPSPSLCSENVWDATNFASI